MKIYLASSRRNEAFHGVVKLLRDAGHEVFNFHENDTLNVGWETKHQDTLAGHETPEVHGHFKRDVDAMKWADAVVLVLPAGKSAHLELGWAAGRNDKLAIIYSPEPYKGEPELMYRMCDAMLEGPERLLGYLSFVGPRRLWEIPRG